MTYSVSSPGDAPSSLTFGPSFISQAADYGGSVILGLNRRLNNQPNTIAAATLARSEMSNLYAIELGNEPNCKMLALTVDKWLTWGYSFSFLQQ